MSIDYGKYDQGVSNVDHSLNAHVDYQTNHFEIWKKHWKRYNLIRNVFIKHQLKKLKKIVCVSRELEKLLNANGIVNTQVIHNGVTIINQPSNQDVESFKRKIGISTNDKANSHVTADENDWEQRCRYRGKYFVGSSR